MLRPGLMLVVSLSLLFYFSRSWYFYQNLNNLLTQCSSAPLEDVHKVHKPEGNHTSKKNKSAEIDKVPLNTWFKVHESP